MPQCHLAFVPAQSPCCDLQQEEPPRAASWSASSLHALLQIALQTDISTWRLLRLHILSASFACVKAECPRTNLEGILNPPYMNPKALLISGNPCKGARSPFKSRPRPLRETAIHGPSPSPTSQFYANQKRTPIHKEERHLILIAYNDNLY